MRSQTLPPSRRMTPEDVLAVLANPFLDTTSEDEAGPEPPIDFDTTVEQWQEAFYLYNDAVWSEWKWLGRVLNDYFRISIPDREWKPVLKPAGSSTLRQVCELIASRAEVTEIAPVTVLGRSCLPAGAFLAVRDVLSKAGVEVADLRPSSPLEPLLKRHGDVLEKEMHKLAPGRLPPVATNDHVLARIFRGMMALGWLMLLVVPIGLVFWLAAGFLPVLAPVLIPSGTVLTFGLAGAVLVLFGAMGSYATSSLPPGEARLGKLTTVRDLCLAIIREDASRADTANAVHGK